jgi:hypothetical protein
MMRRTMVAWALVSGAAIGGPALAETGHDRNHAVYETWRRPDGKGSCCNNFDCRPVIYRSGRDGVEIRIAELGGRWHRVPREAILPFGSFDAEAHACYQLRGCHADGGCRLIFRCVVLPDSM